MTTESAAPSPTDAPPADPFPGEPGEPPFSSPPADPSTAAPPRKPRRPRPVLLLLCGLVVGTAAGGGVGYAVQAHRPPTPLPRIQAVVPTYPAEVLDPAAAADAAPAPLAIDGDLRKLLLTAPTDSTVWDDYPTTPSWITVGERAERTSGAAHNFISLNEHGFRRAAEVNWKQNGLKVRISLLQYSSDFAAGSDPRGTDLRPFTADANGGYSIAAAPLYWNETTEKYFLGIAVAQRGTVQMQVEVFGTQPVDAEVVKGLAKQQWERLV
ncbi:hypothetical protein OG401_08925 [Kitasatospora purpeofusca]|uniref:hypothetical protein n=1 Tax=Kitasatospora purpeofusca TaxID=67352 RepID=UPI0022550CB6|nr:hypothetical protein [Kitasatospora purpeofusca]MCX4684435.1 hypothetical protein [Kitasatospora purpeofusca]